MPLGLGRKTKSKTLSYREDGLLFSTPSHLGFGYDCFLSIENQGNLQLHQSVQCVQFEHSHTPREQRKYRRKNRVPGVLL